MSDNQAPAVTGMPRVLLQIEGAALLVIALALYAGSGASWWLFMILFLAPDLTIAAYLIGPRTGAAIYNIAHTTTGPVLLALSELFFAAPFGIPIALIWAAHIGVDRMCGLGLKYDAGFAFTHLGRAFGSTPAA